MVRRGGEEEGMPSSGAGLLRYLDEETHGPKLEPRTVVAGCIMVIVAEVMLWAM